MYFEKEHLDTGHARVSTLAESQEESYETQVKYYTEYITQEAGWNFVKIYTPIISRELWDKVQERLKWEEEHKTGWTTRRIDSHPYFNRIVCGICGQPYRRTFYRLRTTGENVPMWKCINRFKGKCWARVVSESEVTPMLEKADKVKVTEFSLEAL